MSSPKKKIDPESFFLCRIVGNDLVPRHRLGQCRTNVRFILENEPELEGCRKFWLLNRIVNEDERRAITALLDERKQKYASIPFDLSAYAKAGLDYSRLPPGYEKSAEFARLPESARLFVMAALLRHKNNVAIGVNHARNTALSLGQSQARWVLPWDGNCFLTRSAWAEIRETVLTRHRLPYFIVPMARITDNSDLLADGFAPPAEEEPQIIFRNDARERFDERYPYGNRNKVELLWRLGVPGPWQHWPPPRWELPFPSKRPPAEKFAFAGWVARLTSGNVIQEKGVGHTDRRADARNAAIIDFLGYLDGMAAENGLSA